MINIYTNSPHIVCGPPANPYLSPSIGGCMTGQLRLNTNTSTYEVFDGFVWKEIVSTVPVNLTIEANEAISWAIERKRQEEDLQKRMEKYPGLKEAWEKFQLMDILTKEDVESA